MTDSSPELIPESSGNSLSSFNDEPQETRDIIPLAKLIEYRTKGLSYQEIANIVGCSKTNVFLRLRDYRTELDSLDAFKNHRADVFAVHQAKLLNSITVQDIKSMAPASRITSAAILYDKERLERGQSTANVAYKDYSKQMTEIDAEIAALEAELDEDKGA